MGVVSHLNSVNSTKEMRKAHDECLPMLSEYSSWAGQYKPYFDILKTILASDAFSLLSLPQQKSIKTLFVILNCQVLILKRTNRKNT